MTGLEPAVAPACEGSEADLRGSLARRRRLELELSALRRQLVRFAAQFVAHAADAEDLVQEAYARAFDHHAALAPGTNLRGWMRTVIRHLAIDESRRAGRLLLCEVPRPVETAWIEPELDAGEIAAAAVTSALRRAIAACPPVLRQALELRYFERKSYRDIARALRVPTGTVGTRLRRARLRLRRILGRGRPTRGGQIGARPGCLRAA